MPKPPSDIPKWGNIGPANQWRKPDGAIDYEKMLGSNEGLIWWALKTRGVTFKYGHQELEEMAVEMRVFLCRAAERFNPEHAKWSTYATSVLYKYIYQYQADRSKDRGRFITSSAFEGEDRGSIFATVAAPESNFVDTSFINDLLDGLKDNEAEIVSNYYLKGMTLEEVGKLTNPPLTKERIRQIIAKCLSKMRQMAREDGHEVPSEETVKKLNSRPVSKNTSKAITRPTIYGSSVVIHDDIPIIDDTRPTFKKKKDIMPSANHHLNGSESTNNLEAKTLEFTELETEEGQFVCPICRKLVSANGEIVGLYAHYRRSHKIRLTVNGTPSITRAKRTTRPVDKAPSQVLAVKQTDTTVAESPALLDLSPPELPLSSDLEMKLVSAVQTLRSHLDLLLNPRNVKRLDPAYVDGIEMARELIASTFNQLIPTNA